MSYIDQAVKFRTGKWYFQKYPSNLDLDWEDCSLFSPDQRFLYWIEKLKNSGMKKNPGLILDSEDHLSEKNLELRINRLQKKYDFDLKEYPYISHNRPVNKDYSILFPLRQTHQRIVSKWKDYYNFEDKKDQIIWRGVASGLDRQLNSVHKFSDFNKSIKEVQRFIFVNRFSKKFNIKFVDFPLKFKNKFGTKAFQDFDFFIKQNPNSIGDQLSWNQEICSYKYILNLEGYDWPSSLCKSLQSNSVTIATTPKWHNILHFKLQPWEHYIPIKDDGSDLGDKLAWCKSNDKECKKVSDRASEYMSQFTADSEAEIQKKIFKKLYENRM